MKSRLPLLLGLALTGAFSAPRDARAQIAPTEVKVDLGGGVSLEMVLVKPGTFRQGSPASEPDHAEDETAREVTLTRDFYIGRHEVTVAQFGRFVEAAGYRTEAEKGTSGGFGWNGQALEQRPSFNWRNPGFVQTPDHPVTIVTFDDAMAFSRWLSEKAGRAVTLPTEAQWEFAARSSSTSAYPSGAAKATQPSGLGWSKTNASGGTHPVGEKAPNGLGLFDLAGNVAEWCLDWYGPYDPAALTDPLETRQNLSDKPRRVLRGGSWLRDAKNGRSAARHRNAPGTRNADNGFRVVASFASRPAAAANPAVSGAANPATSNGSSELSAPAALGIFAVVLFAGSSLLVAMWKMARRILGGGGVGAGAVRTEIGEDGFTVRAPGTPVGHRVHYRYTVGGKTQLGSVVLSGDPADGQTVYTGGRPSSISVFAVTAPGQAPPAAKPQPKAAPRDRVTTRTDDDSFRGYPSAYR